MKAITSLLLMLNATFANADCFDAVKSELKTVNPFPEDYKITLANNEIYKFEWSFIDDSFEYVNLSAYNYANRNSIYY